MATGWERSDPRWVTAHNLLLEQEVVRIHHALSPRPHAFVKGIVLARDLYDRLGDRGMVDIDLVVPPAQLDDAVEALGSLGYRPLPDHRTLEHPEHEREAPLVRTTETGEQLVVDLHWHLFDPVTFPLPDDEVWSHLRSTELRGTSVPTTDWTLTTLHLAVHDVQHGCLEPHVSEDLRRAATTKVSEIDWAELRRLAAVSGAQHVLAFALRRAGADVPGTWRARAVGRFVPAERATPRDERDLPGRVLAAALLSPRSMARFALRQLVPPRHIVGRTLGKPTDQVTALDVVRRIVTSSARARAR